MGKEMTGWETELLTSCQRISGGIEQGLRIDLIAWRAIFGFDVWKQWRVANLPY
jgi:hypothetical protein